MVISMLSKKYLIVFDRSSRIIAKYVLSTLMWSITSILILQVFSRYVLNISFSWGEELVRYIMIWMTFGSAIVLSVSGTFSSFTSSPSNDQSLLRIAVNKLSDVSCVLFFLLLAVAGYDLCELTFFQKSVSLDIPMSIVYSIIPISAFLAAIVNVFRSAKTNQ